MSINPDGMNGADWLVLLAPLLMAGLWGVVQLCRTLFVRHDLQAFARRWPRGMDRAAIEQAVDGLLANMNLREKLDQLSGDGGLAVLVKLGIYVLGLKRFPHVYAGHHARLGIPPLSFTDGPRGVVIGHATCFPVAMTRGASWDPALEYRVGQAIGLEASATGANYYAGLCVNLLRHPAWGRAQETFGEDSWHLGSMGLALMHGVQSQHVMVCAKHFAANSIENSRFYLDVHVDDVTLHEIYLPHFRRLVEAGVDSLMSAYNQLNGEYCGHHRHLLTDILREQWGFRGFVSSDWLWGIYDTIPAIKAGMDVEMPYAKHYGRRLRNAVWRRSVPESLVDESVRRVLRAKLQWLTHVPLEKPDAEVIACEAHRQLARESAEQSMVLLRNEGVLPLSADALQGKTVAVIGELAAMPCLGDHGSSRVSPPAVVTLLDGLREQLGSMATIEYHDGHDVDGAKQLAARAEVVLLVVGYHAEDEGENLTSNRKPVASPKVPRGGDRASLDLPAAQEQLVKVVCHANARTVVSVIAGSAVMMEAWHAHAAAILYAGYPGMEGGRAWARILLGEVNPSGKLPFSIPASTAHLPPFDRWAATATYDYYHGYALLDHLGVAPRFAFGFGCSYTHFSCSPPRLINTELPETGVIECSVTLRNTGERAGAEVLQCYVGQALPSREPQARRRLQAFSKVWLQPGEEQVVDFRIPVTQLALFDPAAQSWSVPTGEYHLWVGCSSLASDLEQVNFTVTP